MALILAIEPDRRQAAQLTSLIQTRVGAELVLAETTEQALGAIGDRVPDLVLVPALLAPQDDATLATALRVIAAAAHVQMLTIPVLARARGTRQPLGVLARLRGRRPEPPAPDGCDPDVFGDQIAAYLAEAAAERAIIQSDLEAVHASHLETAVAAAEGDAEVPTESAVGEPSIVAAQAFMPAETVVELAILEPDLETARSTVEAAGDTELHIEAVAEPIADERAIAVAETFRLTELAVEVAIIEPGLDTAHSTVEPAGESELQTEAIEQLIADERAIAVAEIFRLTELAADPTPDEPAIAAAEAFTLVEAVADEEAVIEEVELPAALDLVATSDEEPAARLDVSKPLDVPEAPWFGPQRRWPDLEGVEAVDQLAVFAAEDRVDAEVHTFFPAAVPPSIDDMPSILAAMDESAAVVAEETPIDVQEELAAIDMVPIEEPAPGAVLELWMPLSFGSTRSWPTLEGVWSEARPDPPVLVHADPPAAAAPPAPSPAAARVPSPQEAPAARPEWIELIESLRQDVKRLRSERTQTPAGVPRTKTIPIPDSPPSPTLRPAAVADLETKPRKRAKAAKPAQDEWGFFDPEQCGFAALLAKLDEITDVNDGA